MSGATYYLANTLKLPKKVVENESETRNVAESGCDDKPANPDIGGNAEIVPQGNSPDPAPLPGNEPSEIEGDGNGGDPLQSTVSGSANQGGN